MNTLKSARHSLAQASLCPARLLAPRIRHRLQRAGFAGGWFDR